MPFALLVTGVQRPVPVLVFIPGHPVTHSRGSARAPLTVFEVTATRLRGPVREVVLHGFALISDVRGWGRCDGHEEYSTSDSQFG